jgi:phage shock protein E
MQFTKENTTVVDVRSQGEFMMGHVDGAINIPLQEVPQRVEEIKNMKGTVLLCCASGNRSGQAEMFLRNQGLSNVRNAGSWMDAEDLINQN